MSQPEFGEPIGPDQIGALAVSFKALVLRAGGRVEITTGELERAVKTLVHVEADPERIVFEVVEGAPPDIPRFGA